MQLVVLAARQPGWGVMGACAARADALPVPLASGPCPLDAAAREAGRNLAEPARQQAPAEAD